MTTLASTLKKEIARVARKELREDLEALRKATATFRHEIALLKRELRSTQAQLRAARQASDKALQQLGKSADHFRFIIRDKYFVDAIPYNKIQGQPFMSHEVVDKIKEILA